ncbi:hypothetical protein K7X08_035702 [Anisodus acutangulus]|uniref:ArsA/GET3 Anion-transporting ATPase-like domain-containing protein n=1 Tax=Anisodus acutangulus TaxID=402998 RepID=A0A9Q1R7J2_9SOLA|nr:hypothetical protein K7X08_035702 [Anisodus acutangulus]
MAISESSRLCASLKKEDVPVKRLIANQVLPPSASDCKFCSMKRKDQSRALDMIQNDQELSSLMLGTLSGNKEKEVDTALANQMFSVAFVNKLHSWTMSAYRLLMALALITEHKYMRYLCFLLRHKLILSCLH